MEATAVYDAIVAAHAAPEWAVFPEVSDATGGRASRYADALALNMWPSRGLEIRGFEIKVSRSDLKREIENPAKAEAVGRYCHTWCLATPAGLIKDIDPIPPVWGIFEVVADGTGKFKRLPSARPPEEVKEPTRLFCAAIARAAHAEISTIKNQWVRRESVQEEIDLSYRRGVEHAPRAQAQQLRELEAKLAVATPILAELGVDLSVPGYQLDTHAIEALKLGRALTCMYGDTFIEQALRDIERAKAGLVEIAKNLEGLAP